MNNLINLAFVLIVSFGFSQTTRVKDISETRKIEQNKTEFIGRTLGYLLSKIEPPIKSVMSVPNKNRKEVNTIYLRYVDREHFKKGSQGKEINDWPYQIVVVFNQNWDIEGLRCRSVENPKCADWTKEDERNLGDLLVYDVYVLGKD